MTTAQGAWAEKSSKRDDPYAHVEQGVAQERQEVPAGANAPLPDAAQQLPQTSRATRRGGHDEGCERGSGKRSDRRKQREARYQIIHCPPGQGEWKEAKAVPGKQERQERDPGSGKCQDKVGY